MKPKTLVSIGLLTFGCQAWGQDLLKQPAQTITISDLPLKSKINQPLYIIIADGKTCPVRASGRFTRTRKIRRAFRHFNLNMVQSVDLTKGNDATEQYGPQGKNGVIIITMKDNGYDTLPGKIKKRCR